MRGDSLRATLASWMRYDVTPIAPQVTLALRGVAAGCSQMIDVLSMKVSSRVHEDSSMEKPRMLSTPASERIMREKGQLYSIAVISFSTNVTCVLIAVKTRINFV